MAANLGPRQAEEVFRSEGGRVEVWRNDYEIMKVANVCAAKVVLYPGGLALPKYCDSAQIYYVLEGCGRVGVVFPGSEIEHVRKVRHGAVVAIPEGAINWWYNEGQTDLVILSLGETSKGHRRGEYTNFYLFGASQEKCNNGVVHGFSAEFLAHAWDLDEITVKQLVEAQKGAVIVKPSEAIEFPDSVHEKIDAGYEEFVYNVEDAELDTDVKNGGRVAVLTSEKLPFLKKLGLGADLVKLDPVIYA
ncbi:hypothetical protein O6H91_21G040100 [Diphasiastrum complanatum]|uniref:Uncharacterized protein n=4 Tax=Diphasiastrum complanatum TaxID=34168 RepID=A0ACC2AJP1_DIPCM|nr:hypothetical protein O6H91_Y295800 [Diphasiastrum complanatum]KAJ7517774.1 hypothetical protein O6H91_21G040100 [Diphasiastrum complanatum]KAJ7517775.1 hypothetical protein O6H91_21G040100 [Diphasiastrum complanatum]KAJ7517776.1 hypothetical protein O6H91_21G040100 [Diphasiastrum complanatum]KAJ7517777.1 hypothetical protein O6H91_21G040100 [Diphasiastrum complanatum]